MGKRCGKGQTLKKKGSMYTSMMTSNFQGSTPGRTKQGRPLPGVRRPGGPLEPGLEARWEARKGCG